jgi:SnoaL-like polyketide cyclase
MNTFKTILTNSCVAISVIGLSLPGTAASAASAHEACTGPNTVSKHLEIFDDLDFNVYSHQKWDELKKSHSNDILVHYPDGHTTKGLDAHILELKQAFVFAPDTRISAHPVKFGAGEWTSVIGVMEATFSQPMPLSDGKSMPPTGKKLKLQMVTVGHWNRDCVMDEEYLFWDNEAYAKQLGMGR